MLQDGSGDANPTEQIEPWVDSGRNVAGLMSSHQVSSLASQVTAGTWCGNLKGLLVQTPERQTTDKGALKAETYLAQQMRNLGLTVTLDQYQQTPALLRDDDDSAGAFIEVDAKGSQGRGDPIFTAGRPAPNILAVLPGTDLKNETVLLASHYDSVNWENTAAMVAPGADDNGSGVATLLTAAKVLSSQQVRPRRSVAFVFFSGEEEGLWGSKHFVDAQVTTGKIGHLKGAIILDQVGYAGRIGNSKYKRAILETTLPKRPDVSALVDTLAHSVKREEPALKGFYVNWHGFGSDHIPFRKKGFPAALLIEADDDHYAQTYAHSPRDTFSHVDCNFGSSMARVALRSIVQYAWPKGIAKNGALPDEEPDTAP